MIALRQMAIATASALVAFGVLVACGSFGEDAPTMAEAGDGVDAPTPTTDGSGPEATILTPPEGGADAGTCVDLKSGLGGFSAFTSNGGGKVTSSSGSVTVSYGNTAGSTVGVQRSFMVQQADTHARLTIDGTVDFTQAAGLDQPPGWYADLGKIIHGNAGSEGTSPTVNLVLAAYQPAEIGLFENPFPLGSQSAGGPPQRFGSFASGVKPFHIVLDVKWSTDPGTMNVSASLNGAAPSPLSTTTLGPANGSNVSSWNVVLGGNANAGHPVLLISYTNVCFEAF